MEDPLITLSPFRFLPLCRWWMMHEHTLHATLELDLTIKISFHRLVGIMPVCSLCNAVTPSGRFCCECGTPFTVKEVQQPSAPFNDQQQQQAPPWCHEHTSFEEHDQKTLLYHQQQAYGNIPSAIPVVCVDGDGSATKTNGCNASCVASNEETKSCSASQGSGLVKGRYSDHPNCDVCGLAFDITYRRHQW